MLFRSHDWPPAGRRRRSGHSIYVRRTPGFQHEAGGRDLEAGAGHDLDSHPGLRYVPGSDGFRGLLSGEGVLSFVALGEAPLGLVHCRAVAGESEVLTIAVPTAARRTGVARALMVAACARPRKPVLWRCSLRLRRATLPPSGSMKAPVTSVAAYAGLTTIATRPAGPTRL